MIGAGSSGIAAAKALHQRGFDFDCFEKSDRVGGNWVFKNRNGMSSAYRSLHINTSRERMEYPDFPMPKSYPDFPHHTHIAAYFDDYVDHFGLRERITFETGVERAARGDGAWEVTLDGGEARRYDALMVANGHHWDARWPEPAFPGSDVFAGVQMHSHDYIGDDPSFFRDKRVVVLGMGNSAMDIAVEASFSRRATYLAARRGAWVIPKYVFGAPAGPVRHGAAQSRSRSGSLSSPGCCAPRSATWSATGCPKPDHGVLEAHPTVSDDVLSRIAHGEITPKPNIARLTERTVVFADGSEVEADIVVYCTGYKVTFPFFDADLIAAPDNDLPLFRRVFHPAITQRVLHRAAAAARARSCRSPRRSRNGSATTSPAATRCPRRPTLRADIEARAAAMFKRYVASKRHTMQVDYDDYLADLTKERRRGAERARERGYALPVPPREVAGAAA